MSVTYAAKVDANQPDIVSALRQAGATVRHLHMVGRGCPDIMVGYCGNNYLIEIKNGYGKLTPAEQEFFNNWRGQTAVVNTVDQALKVIGAI